MGTVEQLVSKSVELGLGRLSSKGALIVNTGTHTGRSAKDRLIVRSGTATQDVDWGDVNLALEAAEAERFFASLDKKLSSGKIYEEKAWVGGLEIRIRSLSPWHVAFFCNMFRSLPVELLRRRLAGRRVEVLHDPYGKSSEHGVPRPSDTLIALDFEKLRIGISGSAYAGEIKKGAFTLCNFLLPGLGILPMHAGANCMPDGSNSCVLFGLSGTGKTTLSADPERALIGDDEIVWDDEGLTNLEGGCYAKLIDLDAAKEPEIYKAVNRPGAILENVGFDARGQVNFGDRSRTENTRGSYPLGLLENVFDQSRHAQAPRTLVFLTADAFGALPALARLDAWQAQYHFMSGYTAKVAGTELGVTEPKAAFSACFGAPFMPRPAGVYAKLLAEKAARVGAEVWLLNTGWTGEGYGKAGRYPISVSRRLLSAIQNREFAGVAMQRHPVFGFEVPSHCPGVDPMYLQIPQGERVNKLAARFRENFKKFAGKVDSQVEQKGGPSP